MSAHRERIEFYLLIVGVFLLLIQVFIQQHELSEQRLINEHNSHQIIKLSNFTAHYNTTKIMNEISANLHNTDHNIEVYKKQALAANQVVDKKCYDEIASLKSRIATLNSTVITHTTEIKNINTELSKDKNDLSTIHTNLTDIRSDVHHNNVAIRKNANDT